MTPDRQPSPDDSTTSIVHRAGNASLVDPDTDYLEADVTSIRPSPVEAFLTPWGIGSIFIFLLANSLLTWSQLIAPSPRNSMAEVPAPVEPAKNTAVSLENLSSLSRPVRSPAPASVLPVTTNKVPVSSAPIVAPPAPPVATRPRTTGSLTSALLPPSLQPALMPAHTLPVSQIRQSLPAPRVASSPVTPNVIEIQTPPRTVAQNPAPAPSPALINERMVDELRRREESAANTSFFQREKERRRKAQEQQQANELRQQLPPRPANPASPPASQAQPPSSGTIIIDNTPQ